MTVSGSPTFTVLALDATAVGRETYAQIFEKHEDIRFVQAQNVRIADAKILQERPDILIVDVSIDASSSNELTRRAAAAGMAIIRSSRSSEGDELFAEQLIAQVRRIAAKQTHVTADRSPQARAVLGDRADDVVIAIGASTGGTAALLAVLSRLPSDVPPILIVQHMPEGFTSAFARRLAESCSFEVVEAKGGEPLRRGLALLAPGNRHLRIAGNRLAPHAELDDGPPVSLHRPSVNYLFRSVAEVCGPSAIGVILTGMGDDGAEGLMEMRSRGAKTIAQSKETAAVFGMPGKAIERGAVDAVVPLDEIAAALVRMVTRRSTSRTERT